MDDNQTKIPFTREESIGIIGTLKVTKNLQQIIDRLHYKVGATEWSGILFYKLTKGNINQLKDLEFTADFLYPMNIGSHTYTEFNYSGEIINAYDLYEPGLESSTGLIHSHNNFSTFFSGEDQGELKTNAGMYNYYISLIVNFAHDYCAKIAFPSKTNVTSEYWVKDNNGKLFKRKSVKEESTILIGDLNVIIEDDVVTPEWLNSRIEALELKKKQVVATTSVTSYTQKRLRGLDSGYIQRSNNYYDDIDWKPDIFKQREDFSSYKSKSETSNFSKSQEFLAALIYLDTCKNGNIAEGLKNLENCDSTQMDEFESALDANFEIIHQNVYGSIIQLEKHTLQVLTDLMDYQEEYGLTQGYQIINEIVGSYAL